MKRFLFILVFGLLLIPGSVFGATYYLSDTATDCNDGDTDYNPATHSCGSGSDTIYTDTTNAFNQLSGTDILYVRRGDTIEDNHIYLDSKDGTDADNRITVTAYGTGDDPVISMKDGGEVTYLLNLSNCDFWTIENIKFHGNTDGNTTDVANVVLMSNATYITLSDCTFDDYTTAGVALSDNDCDHVTVDTCYFSNGGTFWATSDGDNFTLSHSTDDYSFESMVFIRAGAGSIIHGNTWDANWGSGYVIKGDWVSGVSTAHITGTHEISQNYISNIDGTPTADIIDWDLDGSGPATVNLYQNFINITPSCGDLGITISFDATNGGTCNAYENIIVNVAEGGMGTHNATGGSFYRNWVKDTGSGGSGGTRNGIGISASSNMAIYNNVIINPGLYGLTIGNGTPEDNLIYNNTIICTTDHSPGQDNIGIRIDDGADGNTYKNNIVYGSEWEHYVWADITVGQGGSGETFDYNLYDGMATDVWTWEGQTHNTLTSWKSETDYVSVGSNELSADPLFTDDANDVLTLSAGSPCIDTGANLGATYDDALHPNSSWWPPGGFQTYDQDDAAPWDRGAYVGFNTSVKVIGN